MKNKIVKIKKEYYKTMKLMTDKQIAEFVKGICDYVYEGKPLITKDDFLKGVFMYVQRDLNEAAQNSINGKKGAEVLKARKRKDKSIEDIGIVLSSVTITTESIEKGKSNVE